VGRFAFAIAVSTVLCVVSTSPARAAQPRAGVEGDLDSTLKSEIVGAIGTADRPILNRFEARRRAREAAENAIAVLRSEGYYAYQVEPDVGEEDIPRPFVRIVPGPRFKFHDAVIEWLDPAPTAKARGAAQTVIGLKDGQPGRAAEVLAAEGRIVAAVQKQGYADAQTAPREVVVDHADYTVRPRFRIIAGELVRLDGLKVLTKGRTDSNWLQHLVTWKPGDPYDPQDVAELEQRLRDTGAYDSVTVALAPKDETTVDGLRPIVVSLAERARRTLQLGASYSTTDGAGLEAQWTRYNVYHRADNLAFTAKLSQLDSRLAVDLTQPHWGRPQQSLKTEAAAYRTTTDAYDETGVGVRADIERRYGKTSYATVGASVDVSRTEELLTNTLTILGRDIVTLGLLADLSLDRSDDPLNPKRGWRVGLRAEPTLLVGQTNLPYLKLTAQGSVYFPFDSQGRTVVAGRVRAGEIFGGSIPNVPASRRFYAGGGGSVRGYGYQAVGPRLSDDKTPEGGVSLMEVSAELRQKVTGRWGVVAFVDGGAVGANEFPRSRDISVGAGLGVRYDLGFGPIRADIAVPLDKRTGDAAFQVYISIGQSF
jgi:translocation and assembly module TamA